MKEKSFVELLKKVAKKQELTREELQFVAEESERVIQEELSKKKMFLRRKVLDKVSSLSIEQLESLLELFEAQEEGYFEELEK